MSNHSANLSKSADRTFYLTRIALLSTIAGVLMLLELRIPIFPEFYKLDLSYFPVVLATFSMGPAAGGATILLKNLLAFLIGSTFKDSMGIGFIADAVVGLSFIIPAGLIYRKKHTKKGAMLALGISLLSAVAISAALNYWVVIPLYAKAFGLDAVLSMAQAITDSMTDIKSIIVYATMPFNAMKWIVVSLLTLLTYKPLSSSILKKPKARQASNAAEKESN